MSKILVIDDEPDLRTAVRQMLEIEGHEILEAADGTEGLHLANKELPGLVICDVHMENMNGFMVHELLREKPATSKIPMILITGFAKEAGAWGSDPNVSYLPKPFSKGALLVIVNKLLAR